MVLLLLAVVVYLLVRLIAKERTRTELLSLIIIVLLTSYGHVHVYLAQEIFQQDVHFLLLPLWALLFTLSIYGIGWRRKSLANLLRFTRTVTYILLVMGLSRVIGSLLNGTPRSGAELPPPTPQDIVAQATLDSTESTPPDIYYIVLDQYARADILQDYYGYDNSAFLTALKERGFYVAEESRTNYLMTSLSIASSLNMQHIIFLSEQINPRSFGLILPFNMIRDNNTLSTLDALGYTTIHFPSGWEGTKYNPNADINYRFIGISVHSFNSLVLSSSILNPLSDNITNAEARSRILHNFDLLKGIAQRPDPTFAFAHFVLPHVPYVFEQDGSPAQYETEEEGYIDQVVYTNVMILDAIDTILAESERPPVIIIQGDHGTLSTGFLAPDEVDDALLRERSGILNAYYFPGQDYSQLYPDITPVNSFRVIFNITFGTDLPLLDDSTYVSTYAYPFAFEIMETPD